MGKSSKHENKSKKKHKHKERKDKKKKSKKRLREKKSDTEGNAKKEVKVHVTEDVLRQEKSDDFAIPVELMNSKSYAPETPEEYQQRQNRMRREIDPVTGRSRLIKGDGEVLEEIVSKERHKSINKETTKGDGEFFQEKTLGKLY